MKVIRDNILLIPLLVIAIFLAFRNYTPNTFLSGWDTLHPEFNFGLAFEREINGVFRSEQGLGAVAGHSHMADLPHTIILYILHFIFPISTLRYLYVFLNLILGPLGMYLLLNKYIVKNKIASFLGSLFYLLNLGTVQQFIVPFEMFTTQYAVLPWIFLFTLDYLSAKQNSKSKLILFSITTLLAAPMAYAATLWYVYFLVFVSFLLSFSFFSRSFPVFKKALILIFLTLAINSFWIFPNIYFVLNHGKEVQEALINKLFSPQAFLYNKEFGNIKDIALLKNFLFDWNVYSGNNSFAPLLAPWIIHLNQRFILLIGYLFAIIALGGVFWTFLKKNKLLLAFIPALLISIFFLLNNNSPTAILYNFLQDKIPLFKEIFRFPDDKVLGILTLVFSLFFTVGLNAIFKLKRFLNLILLPVFFLLIIYFSLPAFSGNLISPYMRVQIPKEYFEMFDWLDKQPENARVANLPINSFWGWKYYSWHESKPSFQGADFLQFGIKQPLLDRDFDRWNPYNEQYYREMSYAIYSQNSDLLKQVLEKYNIKYVLLDMSVISPQSDEKVLNFSSIQNLLESLNFVWEIKTFGDKTTIYRLENKNPNDSYLIQNPVSIYPQTKVFYEDFFYKNYGTYLTQKDNLFYPLSEFINNQNLISPKFLRFNQAGVSLNLPKENNQTLILPSFLDNEQFLNTDVFVKKINEQLKISLYPILPFANTPNPIFAQTASPTGENILSFNQKNIFALGSLENNAALSLGKILLNTQTENAIVIYSQKSAKKILPDFSTLEYFLSYCNKTTNQEIFGITQGQTKNSFRIFGKKNPICMNIPLRQLLGTVDANESMLNVNYNYSSLVPSTLCLAGIKQNACLNSDSNNPPNYFAIKTKDIDNLAIKISFETTSENQIEEGVFENFSLNIMFPFSQITFAKDALEKSLNNAKLTDKTSFIIPFSGEKSLSKDITTLSNKELVCADNFSLNQSLSQKQIVKSNYGDYIEYLSENGSSCDSFSYPNLSQDQGYLIAITSKNIKGLPLSLCIANQASRHCDIYTSLSSFKDFSKDTFLLAPQIKGKTGFDINIHSLGIKNSPSVNALQSIEIIPFPYFYFMPIVAKNNIAWQNDSDVFVYPVSYEKGWKAYEVNLKPQKSKIKNALTNIFPFFFGQELKEHVLVNNWSNGWLIDNYTLDAKRYPLVIIFWPQYLEFLGFAILIGTFIWLVVLIIRSSKTLRTSWD